MVNGKKIIVVMPAFNAEKTLAATYQKIPNDIVDEIILVDDCSLDQTASLAAGLGLTVFKHQKNLGYGANQKTCYNHALKRDADIIIMLHPDYQYDPALIRPMAELIASGKGDLVLGSRFKQAGALSLGMPFYKFMANRILTIFQNLVFSLKLSEYHTGYRAYNSHFLKTIHFEKNSDDFLFDNQLLAQAIYFNFKICEVACPARYESESSSINFHRSLKYGFGVLSVTGQYILQKLGWREYNIFKRQ